MFPLNTRLSSLIGIALYPESRYKSSTLPAGASLPLLLRYLNLSFFLSLRFRLLLTRFASRDLTRPGFEHLSNNDRVTMY